MTASVLELPARPGRRISVGGPPHFRRRGDARFTRIIRAHGNFAEYVPIALILMAFAERLGTKEPMLDVTGAPL